ncbi:sulfotransferase 1 family member D1-like isoform X1 [Bactrocera tryoni]|uniref:sulfotransferase 1 family member D1-like isoform X1 n=2 Tax=Bactrocera tryoni TaxID=59916 RepID=UPI001A9A1D58|nr:sulfotransferase 1 family member D1-like isoform X1 [Bactrocera tryoni]
MEFLSIMLHIAPNKTMPDDPITGTKRREVIRVSTDGDCIPLKWNWAATWFTAPPKFKDFFARIHQFEVRNDDVFIVTFPKCGTTWMQEAAWLLLNNLDYEDASRAHLLKRSVYMDISMLYDPRYEDSVTLAEQLKSPRCIKSHLPPHLLPRQIWQKKVKLIYCARNPKDVLISFSHFIRGKGAYQGDEDDFFNDFLNANITYTPFWPHVFTMWQMRTEPNLFFVTFEEMKRNLRGVLERLNVFLEKPALTEEQMEKLLKHLSFENMKANHQTNPTEIIKGSGQRTVATDFEFMRRGIVGSYKDELSERNQRRINDWSEQFLSQFNVREADIFGDT